MHGKWHMDETQRTADPSRGQAAPPNLNRPSKHARVRTLERLCSQPKQEKVNLAHQCSGVPLYLLQYGVLRDDFQELGIRQTSRDAKLFELEAAPVSREEVE